ncbi:MAG TPA: ACP S-malonyltransferase [Vicinamibacterales bacterium]|nr:ACP S-malonyltransferase [Vicinamibacterales bacterium]
MTANKILYVFPGQGSQYRGMGSDLVGEFPVVRDLYARANDVLGYDVTELSFRDPQEQLNFTRFTQPALLTHEVACLEAFRSVTGERVRPALTAGHSLGEYTALVNAGALTFEAALKLVQRRGELMSEFGRGGMLATTLELPAAVALADKHFCGIGGCNLPDQTVVAGESADLDALAAEMATLYPSKRGVRLNTEGAFHTYLMVGAAQEFRKVLEQTEFGSLALDTLSNYTGKLHEASSQAIRSRLFFQLFNPVRWVGCMNTAIDAGVDAVIEFGGGIGKGEGPDGKRPNLESIIKKSLKWREHQAQYLPAINAATIRATAEQLLAG